MTGGSAIYENATAAESCFCFSCFQLASGVLYPLTFLSEVPFIVGDDDLNYFIFTERNMIKAPNTGDVTEIDDRLFVFRPSWR